MLPAIRHHVLNSAGQPMRTLCRVVVSGTRCLATASSTTANDSPMATLRRRTGLAFSLCRKALDTHDQDLTRAEQWLKAEAAKQGWERALRVADRPAAEGLVAVFQSPLGAAAGPQRLAAMLELNCETDFVARNELFGRLATRLCRELTGFAGSTGAAPPAQHLDSGSLVARMRYGEDQLSQLAPGLVVEAIGRLGENIRVSKACLVSTGSGVDSTGDVHLIGYTHAVGGKAEALVPPMAADDSGQQSLPSVMLGKYGTIIALKAEKTRTESGEEVTKSSEEMQEIGKQLAQHIIGLKPKTIEPVGGVRPAAEQQGLAETPTTADREAVGVDDEESTALLEQRFIFDEDLSVGQYLTELNVKVLDFVRFECGFNE